jgi:hypothetical protein
VCVCAHAHARARVSVILVAVCGGIAWYHMQLTVGIESTTCCRVQIARVPEIRGRGTDPSQRERERVVYRCRLLNVPSDHHRSAKQTGSLSIVCCWHEMLQVLCRSVLLDTPYC